MIYYVILLLLLIVNLCHSVIDSYQKSSFISKSIVGGLTDMINFIQRNDNKIGSRRVYKKEFLSINDVKEGIIDDFSRGYLFTGAIEPELYEENCIFTDPTISFKGLDTFEKNIENLQPILNTFLYDKLVVLKSLEQEEDDVLISTWQMTGDVKIPLPLSLPTIDLGRIDLTGKTRFTLDMSTSKSKTVTAATTTTIDDDDSRRSKDGSGRIVEYYETWDMDAVDALLQVFKKPIYNDVVNSASSAGNGCSIGELMNKMKENNDYLVLNYSTKDYSQTHTNNEQI